jgi:hypothetical protein
VTDAFSPSLLAIAVEILRVTAEYKFGKRMNIPARIIAASRRP